MNKFKKGFTLIELLVVISIIGLLSSVILVGLSQAKLKGIESKRIQELHQIDNAIQLYISDNGHAPDNLGVDTCNLSNNDLNTFDVLGNCYAESNAADDTSQKILWSNFKIAISKYITIPSDFQYVYVTPKAVKVACISTSITCNPGTDYKLAYQIDSPNAMTNQLVGVNRFASSFVNTLPGSSSGTGGTTGISATVSLKTSNGTNSITLAQGVNNTSLSWSGTSLSSCNYIESQNDPVYPSGNTLPIYGISDQVAITTPINQSDTTYTFDAVCTDTNARNVTSNTVTVIVPGSNSGSSGGTGGSDTGGGVNPTGYTGTPSETITINSHQYTSTSYDAPDSDIILPAGNTLVNLTWVGSNVETCNVGGPTQLNINGTSGIQGSLTIDFSSLQGNTDVSQPYQLYVSCSYPNPTPDNGMGNDLLISKRFNVSVEF